MSSSLILPPMPRTLETGDRLTLSSTTYTRQDSGTWSDDHHRSFGTDEDARAAYRSRLSRGAVGAPLLAPCAVPSDSALPGSILRTGDWALATGVTYLWCERGDDGTLIGTPGSLGPWGLVQRYQTCREMPVADADHMWSVTASGRWFVRRGRILRAYLPADMPDGSPGPAGVVRPRQPNRKFNG